MSDKTPTPFSSKCNILGDLWVKYKNDAEFSDFIEYNDLGLPLAYALASDIITLTPKVEMFVNETFDILLSTLEIEDEGFDSLDDILVITQ